MIYLEPHGGLCNRLRTIAGAYKLSKLLKQELTVEWNMYSGCQWEMTVPLSELFLIPEDIVLTETLIKSRRSVFAAVHEHIQKIQWLTDSAIYQTAKKFVHKIREKSPQENAADESPETQSNPDSIYLNEGDIVKHYCGKSESDIAALLSQYKDIHISTCEDIFSFSPVSLFTPTPMISNLFDSLKKELSWNDEMVGLHIRRTDNERSIESSPTRLFEELIEKKLKENPDIRFYLSTDSEEDEKYLKSKYGTAILSNRNKNISRITEKGQIDAVLDFLSLASCKEIYGSYFSSFSEVSALYGGIELHVLSVSK